MPKEAEIKKEPLPEEPTSITSETQNTNDDVTFGPSVSTTLNEDWKKLVDKNPNRLIGCGG
jgi:hypothetical protein